MSDRNLKAIKEGDRVWVVTGAGRRERRRVEEVARVTPTQIVLAGGSRHRRDDGRAIGFTGGLVTHVATPEECEAYDAKVARERQEQEVYRQARAEKERLRRELVGLFGGRVSISEAAEEWEVTFTLTEAAVRRLASSLPDEFTASETE